MIRVYIANLGKYNEGYLVGEWLTLPATQKEIDELMERIQIDGVQYEEHAIHDYESEIEGLKISEYASIEKLNELAEELENVDIEELNLIHEYLGTYDIEQCIEIWHNRSFSILNDVKNQTDMAIEYIDQVYGGVHELDRNTLIEYLDYEELGLYLVTSVEWFYNGCYDIHIQLNDKETGEFFINEFGVESLTKEELGNCFDYESYAKSYLFDYEIIGDKAIHVY